MSRDFVHRFDPATLRQRPEGCFAVEREVRLQDIDAVGIAFFPRVLEYFSDAFLAFLDHSGASFPEVLRERRWGAPIRHVEADYYQPLRYGDRIEIALVRSHLESTAVTIGYRVSRVADGVVTGTGLTFHVFVGLSSFERCAVPTGLARAFARLPPAG
ncbi:MAG: acyl-CoA thioesterase [Polyangiaceae bacterium]|nr:acyl-CoA thioesterase [Polyangiaceae bacterium]